MRKNFILVITLAVLLFPVMSAPADGAGTITGRMLMKDGTPISGGIVIFFDLQGESPPAPERYIRPPDYVADLENDGSFSLRVPPGEYYIGAVKWQDGQPGPPRKGDVFFMVKDERSMLRSVEVTENGLVELGDMAAGEIYNPDLTTATRVSGTVRDKQGNPVAKIIIAAVPAGQGDKSSLFLAPDTGSDGTYTLRLPGGGSYKLGIWTTNSADEARRSFTKTIQIDSGDWLLNVDLQLD